MGDSGDSTGSDDSRGDKNEDQSERLTRNFNELLQELRVTQTGVQILTGFLLTLPFTDRFKTLDTVQKGAYLGVLVGSVIATGLIIAPVAFHRMLFRQGKRPWLVRNANRAARGGLLALALTTSGVVWLVFDLVTDRLVAALAGVLSLVFFTLLWAVFPLANRSSVS
jgi:thiosulfate reductase cytochrome b subunit